MYLPTLSAEFTSDLPPHPSYAMLRETRRDEPMAVSSSRAITQAGRRLNQLLQTYGPQAIAFCLSPDLSVEARYVAAKFALGSLRSSRVACGRSPLFHGIERRHLEMFWGLSSGIVPASTGDDVPGLAAELERGEVRGVWLFGANAMGEELHDRRALSRAELVIVQDEQFTPEAGVADIFFPTSDPESGQARPDWWWVQQVALAMGFRAGLQYTSTQQIEFEALRIGDLLEDSLL